MAKILSNFNNVPVVVLGCNTAGLGAIRSFGQIGVTVYVVKYGKNEYVNMGQSSKYVKEVIQAPEPIDEDEFVNVLLQKSKKWNGALLVPSSDDTLVAVSKNKELLERNGFIVVSDDWEKVQKAIEKNYTYKLAENIGVLVPKTFNPTSIENLKNLNDIITYPCIVKPDQSHLYYEIFNKKMVLVHNYTELKDAFREANEAGLVVIIQEFIPGPDTHGVNYNSYFVNGEPIVEFTAEKVRLSPPTFGFPRVVLSKDIPEVKEPGRKMLKALNYEGFSCMEFKRDVRDGKYRLMEINTRINMSSALSPKCGINFCEIIYNHIINKELPQSKNQKNGIYWIDMISDIKTSLKDRKVEKYRLFFYLKPYFSRHVKSIFAWNDPKPFFSRLFFLIRKIFHLTFRMSRT